MDIRELMEMRHRDFGAKEDGPARLLKKSAERESLFRAVKKTLE